MSRVPNQRWQIAGAQPEQANYLSQELQLHPLLAQVLLNRNIDNPAAAQIFLNPELQLLPSPLEEFEDLPIALELLLRAIAERQFIAICGDYDADGMTSTALLLRALRFLGATVDYAIPSRMQEGYGINRRIIEEFHQEGVGLILTVDNGIAAYDPIARARELGMAVIVTDHHDIPPTLPPANAILNPKLIRADSPYCGVAGVGVAYILAICLAQSLQKTQDLTTPLIELFTLGTIADLAPLTGVNRRWVKRGLKLLPKSRIPGIQALIQVAGLSHEKALKPEAIGFRLGPRINAIGRLSDPQIVIELLTTDDDGRALELAMQCEQVNQLRQRLCELIEQDAVAWCTETQFNPQKARVLVIVQSDWHHGVIGIVASRLVERYGVPVFIGTYEVVEAATDAENDIENNADNDVENNTEEINGATEGAAGADEQGSAERPPDPAVPRVRGSARGIPEFDVFEALQFAGDLLEKFGGHRAAGGFTLKAENLSAFQSRLEEFARQTLPSDCLKPLVRIDAQAHFRDLTLELYERLDVLHPCGIENPDPVFWTPDVQILEQRTMGRDQAHLKLTLAQSGDRSSSLQAIVWRWGQYYPLPNAVDVAYRLRLNEWNGNQSVELELVGIRPATSMATPQQPVLEPIERVESPTSRSQTTERSRANLPIRDRVVVSTVDALVNAPVDGDDHDVSCFEVNSILNTSRRSSAQIEFFYSQRKYTGSICRDGVTKELRISDIEGQVLIIQPEQRRGFLEQVGEVTQPIDVSQPHYFNLVRSALMALELVEKDQLIQEKDDLIRDKDQLIQAREQLIATQEQQILALNHQLEQLQRELSQLQTELQTEWQTERQTERQIERQLQSTPQAQDPIESVMAELVDQNPAVESLEPVPPQFPAKPEDPKQQVKADLGEKVWTCLDLRSQKDLIAAYKKYSALQTGAAASAAANTPVDYSDVALRLCSVIEREVIQPFFKELHQFLLANDEPCEIGGISLRPRKKYTLGMLPPLLAIEWQSFQEDALGLNKLPGEAALYTTVTVENIDPTDRNTVQVFLSQWDHPLANWLHNQMTASRIAQIDRLLTVAADADNVLYDWQFLLLQALTMGSSPQLGILQQIYGKDS